MFLSHKYANKLSRGIFPVVLRRLAGRRILDARPARPAHRTQATRTLKASKNSAIYTTHHPRRRAHAALLVAGVAFKGLPLPGKHKPRRVLQAHHANVAERLRALNKHLDASELID
jgi:hypothetical protein